MERIGSCHPWNDNTYDPAYYKVVFFSSASIWINFLEQLNLDKRFEVVGVVTQPDKPSWRGQKTQSNIIKQTAKKLWITTILTPEKINPEKSDEWKTFQQKLQQLDADFFVVIAYGKIIPKTILDIPQIAPVNVHGSILPKYRGASPLQSVFLNKEEKTGISIMKMNEKMDQGNIIKIKEIDIDFHWTVKELVDKINEVWPAFLAETLYQFWKWQTMDVPQDAKKAIYCKKIQKQDWIIEVKNDSLEDVYSKYQAYYFWPKIFFYYNDKKFIIEELQINKDIFEKVKNEPILQNWKLNLAIESIKIKPEGKKPLSRNDFANWYL